MKIYDAIFKTKPADCEKCSMYKKEEFKYCPYCGKQL